MVVQLLSRVLLFATPWTVAHQASLFFTISQSLLKLMSIESVIPSNYLILCHPLLLLPSIFPSIRVFSNESALCIRWSKYWSFSFNISPSSEYSEFISFGLISLLSMGRRRRGGQDEMVGWHHGLNGHKFEQALGDGEEQGSLACCSPWGPRVGHNLAAE